MAVTFEGDDLYTVLHKWLVNTSNLDGGVLTTNTGGHLYPDFLPGGKQNLNNVDCSVVLLPSRAPDLTHGNRTFSTPFDNVASDSGVLDYWQSVRFEVRGRGKRSESENRMWNREARKVIRAIMLRVKEMSVHQPIIDGHIIQFARVDGPPWLFKRLEDGRIIYHLNMSIRYTFSLDRSVADSTIPWP